MFFMIIFFNRATNQIGIYRRGSFFTHIIRGNKNFGRKNCFFKIIIQQQIHIILKRFIALKI